MNNLATLTSPTTLELPEEIAGYFSQDDEFYVWLEGDTLHMKRVKKLTLQELFKRQEENPDPNPPTMEEVNEIVHEVRRQYQARK